jgi:hypothetical protein
MAKSTLQLVATRRQIAYGAPTRVGLVRDSNLAPALYTDGAGAFRLPPSRRQKNEPRPRARIRGPAAPAGALALAGRTPLPAKLEQQRHFGRTSDCAGRIDAAAIERGRVCIL